MDTGTIPPPRSALRRRRSLCAALAAAAIGPLASLAGASAQTAPAASTACPLPPEIAATFLESKCTRSTLTAPTTFFRYFSSDSNRKGRYLSTDQFKESTEVIRKLAPPSTRGSWRPRPPAPATRAAASRPSSKTPRIPPSSGPMVRS